MPQHKEQFSRVTALGRLRTNGIVMTIFRCPPGFIWADKSVSNSLIISCYVFYLLLLLLCVYIWYIESWGTHMSWCVHGSQKKTLWNQISPYNLLWFFVAKLWSLWLWGMYFTCWSILPASSNIFLHLNKSGMNSTFFNYKLWPKGYAFKPQRHGISVCFSQLNWLWNSKDPVSSKEWHPWFVRSRDWTMLLSTPYHLNSIRKTRLQWT